MEASTCEPDRPQRCAAQQGWQMCWDKVVENRPNQSGFCYKNVVISQQCHSRDLRAAAADNSKILQLADCKGAAQSPRD